MEDSAVIVAPDGEGSLAGYARSLSAATSARTVVVKGCPASFGQRLLGAGSLRGIRDDAHAVRRLRSLEAPLLHFTSQHLARYAPLAGARYLVTVHDLMRHRDWVERGRRPPLIHDPTLRDRLYLRLDAAGLRAAVALIAVSEHTKRELIGVLGVPAERVHVVPEGVDCRAFRPVRERLLDQPYLLYVGSEQPRKNLLTLFRAFMRVRELCPGLKLVKVGAPGGPDGRFRAMTRAHAAAAGALPHVIFAERVSHEELVAWYSGALCLVQPSRHEGFGLPPLEAMACGCPVVASAAAALPEVVGDAGVVYGMPDDVDALSWELGRLLSSPAERTELARAGRARATMSWERTAALTRAVWQQALETPRPARSRVFVPRRRAGRAQEAPAPM
jgi:glycosyltransferase involved in cell wall biosynthesis